MKQGRKGRKKTQPRKCPRGWTTPFPLPRDSARLLQSKGDQCLNLSLWLDRYIAWRDWDDRGHDTALEPMPSARHRKAPVLSASKRRSVGCMQLSGLNDLAAAYAQRQADALSDCRRRGYALETFQACPEWRVVVGLGGASVLETDITLHHLYGLPIVPGSALKGLARAYALLIEKRDEDDPLFAGVFGTVKEPRRSGGVIFFDALPLSRPRFQLDVMNPHYGEYYRARGEQSPPADYLDPTPVYFLTVTRTTFLFALAARDRRHDWLEAAVRWLRQGLETIGIGAKTTAGYGYFEEVRSEDGDDPARR
jgi:CRISPR-associated protein Cmr6